MPKTVSVNPKPDPIDFDGQHDDATSRVALLLELAIAKALEADTEDTIFWMGVRLVIKDINGNLEAMRDADKDLADRLWDLEHPAEAREFKQAQVRRDRRQGRTAKGGAR